MDIATASISPMPFLKFFSLDIGDTGGLNAYNFIFIVIRLKPHLAKNRNCLSCPSVSGKTMSTPPPFSEILLISTNGDIGVSILEALGP